VYNHLSVSLDVYFKDPNHGATIVSTISPGELYSLPLHTIYTSTGEFMFQPNKSG